LAGNLLCQQLLCYEGCLLQVLLEVLHCLGQLNLHTQVVRDSLAVSSAQAHAAHGSALVPDSSAA
jgi:hypothetical protein